jgi:hypothetical protein
MPLISLVNKRKYKKYVVSPRKSGREWKWKVHDSLGMGSKTNEYFLISSKKISIITRL